MKSLAYLRLVLALVCKTSKPSDSDKKIQQTKDKVSQAEISHVISSISSLPQIQLVQKLIPSLELNFLTRIQAITVALVLMLSNSGCTSLVRSDGGKEVFSNTVTKNLNEGKVSRTPILKLGSNGDEVYLLKKRLLFFNYLTFTYFVNDDRKYYFDAETENAVKNFQKDKNLQIDGIVGVKTNEALNKASFEAEFPSSLSGRALFNRGLKQSFFNNALQDYNEAIKRDKNIAEAYYRRGMLYAYASADSVTGIGDKDINKASNDFSEAIKINPDYVEAYLERGMIHNENKDFKSAIDDWNQAILIEPDNVKAYYQGLKKGNKQNQNISVFLNYYKNLNQHEFKNSDSETFASNYNQGIERSRKGDEQGAISDFKKYLQGDPEMEEAKNESTDERKACFNQEIPKEYLDTLESSVPLDAPGYLRRGKLRFLLGDYPGAKRDFQKVIKANPNLAADAYYQKGKVAAYEFYFAGSDEIKKAQEAKEAKESFDEAIKRNPNFSDAYFERGYLKYKMNIKQHEQSKVFDERTGKTTYKNTDVALIDDRHNDFKQAIKIDKSFAQAYYLMVVAERYKFRIKKGETDAIKISTTEINNLTEAIRSDIYFYSDFIGQNRLTMKRAVCVDLGNSKQDNTTKSASIIPFKSKKEEIYYTIALGNYRKKEYKQAIKNISQAIKINADISEFYLIRGAAYYFDKRNNEALKDLKASIKLEPEISPLTPSEVLNYQIIDTTYSSSISHFLIGRIKENQDSQKEYQTALSYLPQADWLYPQKGDPTQTQNTVSSSSAKVRSKKCR